MLSRISSFDDLATWDDSVSHAMPIIVVDPLEESEDPVDPPSMCVFVSRPFRYLHLAPVVIRDRHSKRS
jgi:hypothetical protein